MNATVALEVSTTILYTYTDDIVLVSCSVRHNN